jgi:hypothetical protein
MLSPCLSSHHVIDTLSESLLPDRNVILTWRAW